jgi:RNA polymerase sigma-70 factor (ECF subfamily)
MWDKFESYEQGTNFLGWACTIARHKVFKYYREKKKLGSLLDDEMLEAVGSECAKAFRNDNVRLSALNGCVSKLGPEDQALIKARFKEGTSLKIYAGQSGRSLNTIYKRMAHIYAMLQDCIEQTMEAWS